MPTPPKRRKNGIGARPKKSRKVANRINRVTEDSGTVEESRQLADDTSNPAPPLLLDSTSTNSSRRESQTTTTTAARNEQDEISGMIDDLLQKKDDEPLFDLKARRITIGWIFHNVYGGMEDSKDMPWKGVDGIMPKIKKTLGIGKKVEISHILEDVVTCKRLGRKYTGERVVDPNKKLGRPRKN